MTAFRIFTNDVGPNAYSCFARQHAASAAAALESFDGRFRGVKVLAIRDDEESLLRYGPDGQTGKLPPEHILDRGRKVGSVAGPKRYGR